MVFLVFLNTLTKKIDGKEKQEVGHKLVTVASFPRVSSFVRVMSDGEEDSPDDYSSEIQMRSGNEIS